MKATGIVRRIDDLGRVVIPKEIRRTMRLREGDPLAISTACAGVPRKEYVDRPFSDALERIMEGRSLYVCRDESARIPAVEDAEGHYVSCAMPILAEGDLIGCVVSLASTDGSAMEQELESKLVSTAAGFLGRQLEA